MRSTATKFRRTAVAWLTMVGTLFAAVVVSMVVAAPAQASATASTQAPAPCAESFEHSGPFTYVLYRHCTSGSDSVNVRAIIHWHPDGPCVTVGANQTVRIWTFTAPGSFDRIARC